MNLFSVLFTWLFACTLCSGAVTMAVKQSHIIIMADINNSILRKTRDKPVFFDTHVNQSLAAVF